MGNREERGGIEEREEGMGEGKGENRGGMEGREEGMGEEEGKYRGEEWRKREKTKGR